MCNEVNNDAYYEAPETDEEIENRELFEEELSEAKAELIEDD